MMKNSRRVDVSVAIPVQVKLCRAKPGVFALGAAQQRVPVLNEGVLASLWPCGVRSRAYKRPGGNYMEVAAELEPVRGRRHDDLL